MGLQYYDFTLAPNGVREIPCEGTYFRYYSGGAGGADESILIKSDSQGVVTILRPGQSIKMPTNVKTWRIANNKNAGTITGIVVCGDGEIQDSNTAGSVSVIDGGKARTLAGVSFGTGIWCGGVAGNMSHTQLWNPPGSGKNLIIGEVVAATDATALGMVLSITNAALSVAYGSGSSKKSGGAASAGLTYTQQNASALGGLGIFYLNHAQIFIPKEPIVITPGFGLILRGTAATQGVQATFDYYEDPV